MIKSTTTLYYLLNNRYITKITTQIKKYSILISLNNYNSNTTPVMKYYDLYGIQVDIYNIKKKIKNIYTFESRNYSILRS